MHALPVAAADDGRDGAAPGAGPDGEKGEEVHAFAGAHGRTCASERDAGVEASAGPARWRRNGIRPERSGPQAQAKGGRGSGPCGRTGAARAISGNAAPRTRRPLEAGICGSTPCSQSA